MKGLILIIALAAITTPSLKAQVTEEDIFDQNLMFKDDVDHKDYPEALKRLAWIIENDPNPTKNVYVKGVKVIDANIKLTSDKEEIDKLQVQSIGLYRHRLEKFGESTQVRNHMLTKMYQYWASKRSRYPEVLEAFDSYFEATAHEMSNVNYLAYMDMMRRGKKVGMDISDDKIIDAYDVISNSIELRTSIKDDSDVYMDKIDGIFTKTVSLTCDEVAERYGNSVIDDMEHVGASKLFVKLGIKSGCQDADLFQAALDNVIKYDPSLKLLLYKAKLMLAQEQLNKAQEYFGRALSYELDADTRSEVFVSLAKVHTLKNEKHSAMDYANKAIDTNNSKEAHRILGNLFMSSFSECADGKDIVERRAVFIAAYEQFKLANDSQNMAVALASFPSSEEIHMNNYQVGQEIEINCWFNETVSLSKRVN